MAAITNAKLTIATDWPAGRAKVVVSCDIEFTDFEVEAMNVLGLRYKLQCRVLEQNLLAEDQVLAFDHQDFPRLSRGATRYVHAVFDTVTRMSNLNQHVFGKDRLVAELRLTNQETGADTVQRTKGLRSISRLESTVLSSHHLAFHPEGRSHSATRS